MLGVDGSCKDGKMGSGCLLQIQGGRGGQMCASWQRRGRHELEQAGVAKMPFCCVTTKRS